MSKCQLCGEEYGDNVARGHGLILCIPCCYRAHLTWEELQAKGVFCEHGIMDGDWCEECNKEYKEARREEESEEAQGVQGV